MDAEIDVPPFFLCPISLEIMKDPVTLSTGITYDRESIEKWLFSGKRNDTCPVTKQSLSDSDLTPNHTLRRLIQAWCTMNASHGVERIPTPKPPVSKSQIAKLLSDAKKSPQSQITCLRRLRSIAVESEANRRCLESSAAVEFLASLILSSNDGDNEDGGERAEVDEAISILHNLQLSESAMKAAVARRESEFVEALVRVMRRRQGSFDSRAYSVMLLKSVFDVAEPVTMMCLKAGFFSEVVRVLKDQVSPQATKAALQLLISLCPWGRNRIKAVEAGAAAAAVEMLLETAAAMERRRCEMVLAVLELTSGCAEGRAELLGHAAGMAAVSKKVLRVSNAASERAVRVLLAVAKFSATPAVVAEMASIGVVAKMCLVLQVDCGPKTKEKAREILRIHARSWKNSPCVPKHLLSSYPN